MATYTADGNVINLNKIHAYADRLVKKQLISGLYKRSPLLTYLAGKTRGDTRLGRPGTLGLIGGAGNFSEARRMREMGLEVHLRLQADRTGGVKVMGERDTTPSTGNTSQDQNVTTAVFRWAGVYSGPIKIWNETIRTSRGAEIGNAVEEAVEQATEDLYEYLIPHLWHGAPSDQSANVWSAVHGVVHALGTTNTYGTLNRSNTTFTDPDTNASVNYWAGKRVTTAKTASLDLLDDAMYEQGVYEKSPTFPDLVLCGSAVYHTLKREALARGQQVVVTNMPEAAEVGVEVEAIKYGNTTIVADPWLTGDWSGDDSDISDATKVVVMLKTEDWVFAAHPTENFRVTPFVDQGEQSPGLDDAITAQIRVKPRLYCAKPWRSIIYTNITA